MRIFEIVRFIIEQIATILLRKRKPYSEKSRHGNQNIAESPNATKDRQIGSSSPIAQEMPRTGPEESQNNGSGEPSDLINQSNSIHVPVEENPQASEPEIRKVQPDQYNSVTDTKTNEESNIPQDHTVSIEPALPPQTGPSQNNPGMPPTDTEPDGVDFQEIGEEGGENEEKKTDQDEGDNEYETTPEGLSPETNDITELNIEEDDTPTTISTLEFPPYFKRLISSRAEIMDDGEVNQFLDNLRKDDLTEVLQRSPKELDNYFFHAIKKFDFIGELPISHKAFDQIAAYVKKIGGKKGGVTDPKPVPPAIFFVSMVFCARYSNTEARRFWTPYAQMVWGQQHASQGFQNKMRQHFQFCRYDLERSIQMPDRNRNLGEVVRPVYRHAIIPHYLHEEFAEWLTKNFETFLQLTNDQLKNELADEKFLGAIANRLKYFISGKETQETALRLITNLINAIKFFKDIGSTTEFEQFIVSPIERSLWELIQKKIISDETGVERLRRRSPHLDWMWDLEMEELILKLSNVQSNASEKPDSLYWAKDRFTDLKTNYYYTQIYPWKLQSGDWDVDPIHIPVRDEIDGSIMILSEDYDLEKEITGQEGKVLFEKAIDTFDQDFLFFRIDPSKKFAVLKDKINTNGCWLIISREKTTILDKDGHETRGEVVPLLKPLQNSGYQFAVTSDLVLPVKVRTINLEQSFNSTLREEIIAVLNGKLKFVGLSKDIPPVYASRNVELVFNYDSDEKILQRTWLTVQRYGDAVQSVLLSDYKAKRKIEINGSKFIVDLSSLIPQPGLYTIKIWKNLTSVLSEQVQFAWLPDTIQISEPRPDVCYSPTNQLILELTGIQESDIEIEGNELIKFSTLGDKVQIKWETLKSPNCRIKLNHSGSPVSLAWNLDRVWSWVDGITDIDHIMAEQIENVIINISGKPKENFALSVNGSSIRRENSLDARGRFSELWKNTSIRDMVVMDDHAISTIIIEMRDLHWKLLSTIKESPPLLEKVTYKDKKLLISFTNLPTLQGVYSLYISNLADHSRICLHTLDTINNDFLTIDVPLNKGDYILEIELEGRIIQPTISFSVGENILVPSLLPLNNVFDVATASRSQILEVDGGKTKFPDLLMQMKHIHTKEEWITDGDYNEGIKRLLPSWAVLSHPLAFKVTRHGITIQVFPERAAYGGRVGMGHVEIPLGIDRVNAAAFWRPEQIGSHSLLRMGFPENGKVEYFSELDDYDLWPVYQCKDCGKLLGSSNGSYIKLPPSVIQRHDHGIGRKMIDQFTDTLNEKKYQVKVAISQQHNTNLDHKYGIEKVLNRNFATSLLAGKQKPELGELSRPIDPFVDRDHKIAVSEFVLRFNEPETQQFIQSSPKYQKIYYHLVAHRADITALKPLLRMSDFLKYKQDIFNKMTVELLSLCLLLRLKTNSPDTYFMLKKEMHVSESEIAQYTTLAAKSCPKLFEWCITWAELFCVHAIS